MHLQNFIKIHHLVHKILSINQISVLIKGHNSAENELKILFNHPNLHLVNINAYTKFDRNPKINLQDIIMETSPYSFGNFRKLSLYNCFMPM